MRREAKEGRDERAREERSRRGRRGRGRGRDREDRGPRGEMAKGPTTAGEVGEEATATPPHGDKLVHPAPVAAPAAHPPAAQPEPSDGIGVSGERLTRQEAFSLMGRAVAALTSGDRPVPASRVRQQAFDLLGRDSESLSERNFIRILKDAHDGDVIDLRRRGDDYEVAPAVQVAPVAEQLNRAAAAAAPPARPTGSPAIPRGMGPRGAGARGRGPAGRGSEPPPDLLLLGVVEEMVPAPPPPMITATLLPSSDRADESNEQSRSSRRPPPRNGAAVAEKAAAKKTVAKSVRTPRSNAVIPEAPSNSGAVAVAKPRAVAQRRRRRLPQSRDNFQVGWSAWWTAPPRILL